MNIGVHLSLGPRPEQSLRAASACGATCVQIFASSPSMWRPPAIDEKKGHALRQVREELGIDPLVIHAVYLINLASADPVLVERSIASLIQTLRVGVDLSARGVITHLGSHGGRGYETVANAVAAGLVRILNETPEEIDLVLENSAGSGGILGSRIEELGDLIDRAGRPSRLKIALDTAHLCGSGWDLTDPAAPGTLVETVEDLVGLDRLLVLHSNDSLVPVGSRRDRHANIGDGHIGLNGFRNLLTEPALAARPWILETPDLDTRLPEDRRFGSLLRLRALVEERCSTC